MNEEQESILYVLLDKLCDEASWLACTPEEVAGAKKRIVEYVRVLADGTHFLSDNA